MDILNSTNLYGWLTSLIRRRGRRKFTDQNNALVQPPNVDVKTLIPNIIAPVSVYNQNEILDSSLILRKQNNEIHKTKDFNLLQTSTEILKSKMEKDNKNSEKSNENSIEEDIEEMISAGGSIDESISNDAGGGKLQNITTKKRQLFDINDDDDSNVGDHFKIDDNQLSGRQLAAHFKINDDDNSQRNSSSNSSKKKSKTYKKTSKKHSSDHKQSEERPSLTNQSTTNDVSDLANENSIEDEEKELYTRSLDLGNTTQISYEQRGCESFETAVKNWKLPILQDKSDLNVSMEKDRSYDEVIETNPSFEISFDDKNLSSLPSDIDINNESEMNKILSDTPKEITHPSIIIEESSSARTESEEDINGLKQKILSMTPSTKSTNGPHLLRDTSFEQIEDQQIVTVKQMERVHGELNKEVLEDITEESEKISAAQDKTSDDFDSIVSLNMIQKIENEGKEFDDLIANKEIILDSARRRELFAGCNESRDSLRELPPSGRDSCSLATTSTEYRTILDDLGTKVYDFHTEIARRDQLIEDLKSSLEQSVQLREQLQQQTEKLSGEVQQLRKHIQFDTIEKPYWPRDQESSGQRLSEISLDLVSESDEDLDRNLLTDEEKVTASSRNSKERQLGGSTGNILDACDPEIYSISKQIGQFHKYLNADESRIFFMVQKKFDDFLSMEIEKSKMKYDTDVKMLVEQLESEKHERDAEIYRLQQLLTSVKNGSTELMKLRQELGTIHAREMEDLRVYFEKKCADLEKQYSEEVFSQKSQRDSIDTNSDISDKENFPEECVSRLKEGSPRKKTREELYASPSHRQITPTTLSQTKEELTTVGSFGDYRSQDMEPQITIEELEGFYKEKIQEITRNHEEVVRKLAIKLKRFETTYAADEFMKNETNTTVVDENLAEGTSSYLIVDQDDNDDDVVEAINESQEIRKIAAEYERRLEEQVALAKEDILHELERQIQALLSESTTDDQHWPPEFILLREKFTAKSQLEIAQLQIKHEEEMSRLKVDYEKQLNRKVKRNSTFDLTRDLDAIVSERENLRELSNTFRYLLTELVKYVSVCEDDLNNTLLEELHKLALDQQTLGDASVVDFDGYDNNCSNNLNGSTVSNRLLQTTISKKLRLAPDVSGLLSTIEDPQLVEFITQNNGELSSFNLQDCLDKLKLEANHLLKLSEELVKKRKDIEGSNEKSDSCEEEDGLKSGVTRSPQKILRASSLNENLLNKENKTNVKRTILSSLPPDLNQINLLLESDAFSSSGPVSELNFQVHELKNRLVKSESDRHKLQEELKATIKRNFELGIELNALREQLEQLDSQKEDYSEGYGLADLKSPPRLRAVKKTTSFSQLQEKARNILSTPTKMSENSTLLLQMIEDFCREGDKVIEDGKKDRDDLQAQIDAADKQLKGTRQFLEEQATEREFERDEFMKEIENLKNLVREKEKERSSFEIASKEITKVVRMVKKAEQMEQQIKELSHQVTELDARKDKLEIELKASIDKIFVLRDIISDLETQVQTKALNEHVLGEKVKELEAFIASQNNSHDILQQEIESLKSEIGQGYQERISQLEEQLRNSRSNAEQSSILGQITEQLHDIETTLDQKIKTLEALHQSVSSISCSISSPVEDVSLQAHIKAATISITPQGSPMHPSPKHHSLPIEEVQRVFDKLGKHTRAEEAAIKRIRDLEMQVGNIRTAFSELQNERDVLQERMSEQLLRISTLQSKLEEQRRRAEELQRQGTSDLNIRIHDLQNEIMDLKETLSARDKQITNLKNHLEQSKAIIDRQEAELAVEIQSDRSAMTKLEVELKGRTEENKRLKDKIKNEMINKLALPDLMETMLADKNEEIDHLREQLEAKRKELEGILAINLGNSSDEKEKTKEDNDAKLSGRTLSDIVSISEYDEPEVVRRAPVAESETPLVLPQANLPDQAMDDSKPPTAKTTEKQTADSSNLALFGTTTTTTTKTSLQPMIMHTFDQPHYFQMGGQMQNDGTTSTPTFAPRQINFSEFVDDSRFKESTPKIQEIFDTDEVKTLKAQLQAAESKIESLKISLKNIESETNSRIDQLNKELQLKTKLYDDLLLEKNAVNEKLKKFEDVVGKNEELKLELSQKSAELAQLEDKFKNHKSQSNQVEEEIRLKDTEIDELKNKFSKILAENESLLGKVTENNNTAQQIDKLKEQVDMLNKMLKEKDEVLTKQEKNLLNFQSNEQRNLLKIAELENRIQTLLNKETNDDVVEDLNSARAQLSEKVMLYEKCLLDIQSYKNEIEKLMETIKEKDNIINTISTDSKSLQNIISAIQNKLTSNDSLNEVRRKLREERELNSALKEKNSGLETELENLRSQNSENSKQISLDEIAAQVEKELNYSAQLDTNILKAIESEEEIDFKTDHEKLIQRDLMNQVQVLKSQLEEEKSNSAKIQKLLNEEKQHSQEVQQQDASIIEAMRLRLEDALRNEEELHKLLDEERDKCERLSTQITALQRSEARKSSMLLKSPTNSPRKSPRSSDSESEVAERLKSEIKLLQAQNERERDRVNDLQRALEREKDRFDTEVKERIDYAERLKREMEKLAREKDLTEQETDHLQERLTLALREIESLEARISVLQEVETRRVHRRDRERTETVQNAADLQELKAKLISLETERENLNRTITMLRGDIERGAQRESKLAETLALSAGDTSLPHQFLQKMKEMNNLLVENTKENRQMVDTIQILIEERKILQKKVEEMESENRIPNYTELEERANHLFGKYLRVESHRKALVHQKRYLLIVLRGYEESETKALAALATNGNVPTRPKGNLFKTVALSIIAIQRMKFIVKRWHSGKRIVSKSIFNIPLQKRPTTTISAPSVSPPCRDTAQLLPRGFTLVDQPLRPLQTPGLISDYSQKFDWSRLKKTNS